ncbi:hypothetical protein BDV06DRAFT_197131, partial [Aspergillus oleicola]
MLSENENRIAFTHGLHLANIMVKDGSVTGLWIWSSAGGTGILGILKISLYLAVAERLDELLATGHSISLLGLRFSFVRGQRAPVTFVYLCLCTVFNEPLSLYEILFASGD